MKSNFAEVNQIKLHYIEYKNDKPQLLLLHGLTANAFAFNGMVESGLKNDFSIISVDQRGRGLSTKTAFNYSINDHALDIIGLLDHLHIEKVHLCGHSFGGLLATHLSYYYPDRFDKTIILDAAPEMNPNTPEMLAAALSRIDAHYTNFDEYLNYVKQAPYLTFWDEHMLPYYQADVAVAKNGSVESRSNLADIMLISMGVANEDWTTNFSEMKQKSLLIVAVDDYTLNQPLLPTFKAKEIIQKMQDCKYAEVNGNHQTMLFGKGAIEINTLITQFIHHHK
jgi:pimeloyl-ACP methyl ester carboxylesterase